ncbi:hypothetical protein PG993_007610 [Apiospora rasikravindrae]|uniref:Asl1-like glycosyl hydrolase catalytic domain-containing protein n=1 Tax=Apiospora rasikravindrae TaxID=990691 RepID=A0ABR1SZT8_9PEZI
MFSKYIVPALCASNLLGVVAAANHHRHMHKRDYIATEVEVVTDIVTVYVTEGDLPTPAPAPAPAPASSAKPFAAAADRPSYEGEHKGKHHGGAAAPSPATTTTPVAPVVAPSPPVEQAPAPQPTTMVTATKAAPSPEQPEVSVPTQAAIVAPAPIASQVSSAVSSAVSQAAPASQSKGGKRGLAYNDAKLVSNICSSSNKFSWAYNWGSHSDGLEAPVTYIPTLWGPQPEHSNGWSENAQKAISAGADYLMSFNECDNAGQCNMDPASAAAAHKSFMQPFVGKAKILAPSITSSESVGQGISWLKSFMQACGSDCPMDACNAHWYGPGGVDGAELFLKHLKAVNTACGKDKVWVTEFAATSGDVDAFMSHALTELDTKSDYDFVEKYSYFYLAQGSLMQSSSALSTFGNIYATL